MVDVNRVLRSIPCALALALLPASFGAAQKPLPRLADGDVVILDGKRVRIESSNLQQIRRFPKVGPPRGVLLLVGGGVVPPHVLATFADLAGGKSAPIVLIPTANCRQETFDPTQGPYGFLRGFGFSNVSVLHTRDRARADSPSFVEPLAGARAVWLAGGGAECLMAPYLHTRLHEQLAALLDRGGVVAGSSAGAVSMGSYFEVRLGAPRLQGRIEFEGWGFLSGVTVAPHMDTQPRTLEAVRDLIETTYPGLLGIGIEEGSAVLVRGDELTVVGDGRAAVYDLTRRSSAGKADPLLELGSGAAYDLAARTLASKPLPAGGPGQGIR